MTIPKGLLNRFAGSAWQRVRKAGVAVPGGRPVSTGVLTARLWIGGRRRARVKACEEELDLLVVLGFDEPAGSLPDRTLRARRGR